MITRMDMNRITKLTLLTLFLLLSLTTNFSYAETITEKLTSTIDNVWLIVAASLVFLMQAGFSLLEAGVIRTKNAVHIFMKNYTDICFGSIGYWAVGFGLMFGLNSSGFIGTDHFFLISSDNINFSNLLYQTMFAATATTIISGAVAERIRYWPYLLSSILITSIIYPVSGSWVWGGLYGGQGWLAELGFIDFAGSTVVHTVGGWAALSSIIVLGPRLGKFDQMGKPREIRGHNLPMVALGGFILWLGWFGFNGGSAAASEGILGKVLINTHLSACAAVVGGLLTMVATKKPVYLKTTVICGIGGLVAITAGCATMNPLYAIITGFVAGFIVVEGSKLLNILRVDDVVGAIPAHAFCGVWGTLAVGLFQAGAMFDLGQIKVQIIGIVAVSVWSFVTSFILYFSIDKLLGMRASTSNELKGLDYTEHYEISYPEFQETTLQE